jgi:hypothetical protein
MGLAENDNVVEALASNTSVLWRFPLCGVRSDNQQLELLALARPPHN